MSLVFLCVRSVADSELRAGGGVHDLFGDDRHAARSGVDRSAEDAMLLELLGECCGGKDLLGVQLSAPRSYGSLCLSNSGVHGGVIDTAGFCCEISPSSSSEEPNMTRLIWECFPSCELAASWFCLFLQTVCPLLSPSLRTPFSFHRRKSARCSCKLAVIILCLDLPHSTEMSSGFVLEALKWHGNRSFTGSSGTPSVRLVRNEPCFVIIASPHT